MLGEDAKNIESQLERHAEIVPVGSIAEAVTAGFEAAEPGDTVLLAPACASFDMFKSFEERGEVFKTEVERLRNLVAGEAASNGK